MVIERNRTKVKINRHFFPWFVHKKRGLVVAIKNDLLGTVAPLADDEEPSG